MPKRAFRAQGIKRLVCLLNASPFSSKKWIIRLSSLWLTRWPSTRKYLNEKTHFSLVFSLSLSTKLIRNELFELRFEFRFVFSRDQMRGKKMEKCVFKDKLRRIFLIKPNIKEIGLSVSRSNLFHARNIFQREDSDRSMRNNIEHEKKSLRGTTCN